MEEVDRAEASGAGQALGMTRLHQEPIDVAIPDALEMFSTPQQVSDESLVMPSGSFSQSGPQTRSRTNRSATISDPRNSKALHKLQAATKRPSKAGSSRPRAARSTPIRILKPKVAKVSRPPIEVAQTTPPLRFRRSQSRIQIPTNPITNNDRILKKTGVTSTRHLRRSARLAKPLKEFQLYPELPAELRIIIWEQAACPRLIYLRNKNVLSFNDKVQNAQPTWFKTDQISEEVSSKKYKMMFGPHTGQYVNLDMDIIILEPCCNGCRGYWCTKNMFSDADRSAVRFLAIQTDSPYLAPIARPCWETITASFPNVRELFLLKMGLKGDLAKEQALIEVADGTRESDLRKRFNEWKKGEGRSRPVTVLKFAVVVDKEPESISIEKRYRNVEDRKTGTPQDIILG